ncbi:MAG: FAD-dependent oxidoreductase [Sandaracinaceae bacterium]|nr:FAD-dependent oxidoreductase [Sandaracinaceae bacterium]
MSADITYDTEIVIAGGGLAGLVTAHELLDKGRKVLVLDRDVAGKLGGLAKESFGGVHMIDTPHMRKLGLRDTPDLAMSDWESYAHFGEGDTFPRQWARFYCENSDEYIFRFLDKAKVEFLPVVNWPERGLDKPGNSIPRWHIAWGTGHEIIARVVAAIEAHPRRSNLTLRFEHTVSGVEMTDGRATGLTGTDKSGKSFRVKAEHVVIAAGGICGGDLSKVRANWYAPWGQPPKKLLNGAHIYGDGMLHDEVARHGANVTHLDKQWHYAAGVHHPRKSRPDDGLSLVPPRSGLWMNAHGERIRNPRPLVAYTDTRHLVESILKEPGQYAWIVMNHKIAIRELGVSGCSYMTAFFEKNKAMLVRDLITGNKALVARLLKECPDDFVQAKTLPALVEQMNQRGLDGHRVDLDAMRRDIGAYDDQIDRGPAYFNDEQLRQIMNFRTYRGDKIRTCKYQKILDPKAGPLIAIRSFILSRKSLGGIQTDLRGRVMRADGAHIPGLFAVGEAAGFGGGGIHGRGSLEGTFLGGCVLTGRVTGRAIAGA